MAAPPDLPAALLRRAASDPEEPWLFRSEGWDWVWHPWKELAGWMTAWAERLASLPPGSRAAFLYKGNPESVVLDLAVQAAGLVSMPVSRREDGAEAEWIEPFDASPPGPLSRKDAGGAVVRAGDVVEEWDSGEILDAAARIGEAIGSRAGREIVVLGGPLGDPLERTMMAWATVAGAAVVLEPDPALRAATAAWVRPTVFHGSPAEISDLRARAGRTPRLGSRLPFRRLRTVLPTAPLPLEDVAFWTERGVRIALAAKRQNHGI